MRVGIATDHGGFALKEELVAHLRAAGHEVVDFGAHALVDGDDYPDFVVPLADAVARARSSGVSPSAGAAWVPRCAPTRCPAFAPRSSTTTSRPVRASRTTT